MEKFIKPARIAYAIGLTGMVLPQLFYGQFGPNFFPAWPGLPFTTFWVYLFTLLVVVACAAIILEKNGRTAALILGGLLLAIYFFGYIPYELIIEPHNNNLGSWADGLEEPALAGGAFIVAGTFPKQLNRQTILIKLLGKLIVVGPALFCITMILFGICHFLYTQYILTMVPAWLPGPAVFWTRFAGAALIGSGVAIAIGVKQKLAATLLGIMIFIWLIIIHIPSLFPNPFGNHCVMLVSAFSALAFVGAAVSIAYGFENYSILTRPDGRTKF
ncbi:hypothetical protein HDF24_18000 [Mucilaginibacter sp. X4EP1]|uniref:hypothetical protein n=1 Tax=Mucilaginibacter sp. X4EP1 TaxID=2723092 RepID=UPI0021689F76|nr:hypothetical protein [Mucilaginibacter sp. X4EP1]MCS3813536.1 putative membrane protein YphA (DoxX/SURF4 family) [Mucilaginibacter sp. X4EP1]